MDCGRMSWRPKPREEEKCLHLLIHAEHTVGRLCFQALGDVFKAAMMNSSFPHHHF